MFNAARLRRNSPYPPLPLDPSRACLESVRGLSGVQDGQGPHFDGLQRWKNLRRPATGVIAICLARDPSKRGQSSAQHHQQCETAPVTSFTGTAWRMALNAQAMLVPSYACLTFGKGPVKLVDALRLRGDLPLGVRLETVT